MEVPLESSQFTGLSILHDGAVHPLRDESKDSGCCASAATSAMVVGLGREA